MNVFEDKILDYSKISMKAVEKVSTDLFNITKTFKKFSKTCAKEHSHTSKNISKLYNTTSSGLSNINDNTKYITKILSSIDKSAKSIKDTIIKVINDAVKKIENTAQGAFEKVKPIEEEKLNANKAFAAGKGNKTAPDANDMKVLSDLMIAQNEILASIKFNTSPANVSQMHKAKMEAIREHSAKEITNTMKISANAKIIKQQEKIRGGLPENVLQKEQELANEASLTRLHQASTYRRRTWKRRMIFELLKWDVKRTLRRHKERKEAKLLKKQKKEREKLRLEHKDRDILTRDQMVHAIIHKTIYPKPEKKKKGIFGKMFGAAKLLTTKGRNDRSERIANEAKDHMLKMTEILKSSSESDRKENQANLDQAKLQVEATDRSLGETLKFQKDTAIDNITAIKDSTKEYIKAEVDTAKTIAKKSQWAGKLVMVGITGAIGLLMSGLSILFSALGALITFLVPIVISGMSLMLSALGFLFSFLVTTVLPAIGTFLVTVVLPAVIFVVGHLLMILGILLLAGLLIFVIYIIIKAIWSVLTWVWDMIWGGLKWMWDGLSGVFSSLWQGLKDAFSWIWDIAKKAFNLYMDWYVEPILSAIESVWNWVSGFFKSMWSGIEKWWSGTDNEEEMAIRLAESKKHKEAEQNTINNIANNMIQAENGGKKMSNDDMQALKIEAYKSSVLGIIAKFDPEEGEAFEYVGEIEAVKNSDKNAKAKIDAIVARAVDDQADGGGLDGANDIAVGKELQLMQSSYMKNIDKQISDAKAKQIANEIEAKKLPGPDIIPDITSTDTKKKGVMKDMSKGKNKSAVGLSINAPSSEPKDNTKTVGV